MKVWGQEVHLHFSWKDPDQSSAALPGFILLVLFAHVAAFLLFRVVYPQQASFPAPPPTVTVLDPSRPDHRALLRWAEAEDASPGRTQTALTERLMGVTYQPSYLAVRTAPLTLPATTAGPLYPPARDPYRLIRSVEAAPGATPQVARGEPTSIRFSTALALRSAADIRLNLQSRSSEPLAAPSFLVGVASTGELRFVILQDSSGLAELDAEIASEIRKLRLKPDDTAIVWGEVRVLLGSEIYLRGHQ